MTEAERITTFLNDIHPLDQEDMDELLRECREVDFPRNILITREGQIERYLYFVLEGIQRSYYIKDEKEYVIAFTYTDEFSGLPESLLTQRPARYNLATITQSRMLRIPYEHLAWCADAYHGVERLLRIATGEVLDGFIHRHYELLALSMEERFVAFMQRSGHLIHQIPHKYIASYLGMDPTNFSKLLHSVPY
ncbi:MAG: Crp/Fnr family transcriptional regulator [Bacteroidota bacterium]